MAKLFISWLFFHPLSGLCHCIQYCIPLMNGAGRGLIGVSQGLVLGVGVTH